MHTLKYAALAGVVSANKHVEPLEVDFDFVDLLELLQDQFR
jgi:hypothetical protein